MRVMCVHAHGCCGFQLGLGAQLIEFRSFAPFAYLL